jgi:hypothetical protein
MMMYDHIHKILYVSSAQYVRRRMVKTSDGQSDSYSVTQLHSYLL